ncbi:hypothetical protein H5410_052065 [Solanum commersonii]|uniref:Amine oxidase domain-containing protein n=1 Tax=Solanum commersonii TaxID=4109 RepID=A0A9J5X2J9_SOLCO|nr:hypothetical protein H5410_052065 [Solanum commersonii]
MSKGGVVDNHPDHDVIEECRRLLSELEISMMHICADHLAKLGRMQLDEDLDMISAEPSKGRVIVIGARLAGLAAARKLMSFGFEVTVFEGRKRVGGRVYKKDGRGNKVTTADLGGIVLTGTLGNPPGLFVRQLSYTLHKVRETNVHSIVLMESP